MAAGGYGAGMTARQWDRVGTVGIVAVLAAFASALLGLPGVGHVAPWLFAGGLGAVIVAAGGKMSTRRRERRQAEAEAERKLDEIERRDRQRDA
jgi:hypothetical protein